MVDLPEAERPVNQIVRPGCRRRVLRSVWVREWGCQVMFLQGGGIGVSGERRRVKKSGMRTYVAMLVGVEGLRTLWEASIAIITNRN